MMIVMMMMVMMIMMVVVMVMMMEIFLNNSMNSMLSHKINATFSFFLGSKAFSVAKNFAIGSAKVPMEMTMIILMYNKAIRHDPTSSVKLSEKMLKDYKIKPITDTICQPLSTQNYNTFSLF